MNTGTPDGGGLGFLLKLLLTAESLGNGFVGDMPLSLPSALSHKPLKRLHAGIYAWADGFPVRA